MWIETGVEAYGMIWTQACAQASVYKCAWTWQQVHMYVNMWLNRGYKRTCTCMRVDIQVVVRVKALGDNLGHNYIKALDDNLTLA